jgi:hypothetical protein
MWKVLLKDGSVKEMSDVQYQNNIDNGIIFEDEKQISIDTQDQAKQMKSDIAKAREQAIKEEYPTASKVLLPLSSFLAPESYKETMETGDTGVTMENVKEVAPTLIGMGAGGLATKAAIKALPTAAKTISLGNRVPRGGLEVAGKKLLQNVIGAEATQVGTDVAETGFGEEGAFSPEDYLIGLGIAGGASLLSAIGPMAKNAMIKKMLATGQFKDAQEAERRAEQAFQTLKSSDKTMSSPKNFLEVEKQKAIAQAQKEFDDIAYELKFEPGEKLNVATRTYLKNKQKALTDQIKNIERNYNNRISNFDKDQWAALGESQKMSSEYLEGTIKPHGYNKQTLRMFKQVDAPTAGKAAEIDRMARAGTKLAPPEGLYKPEVSFLSQYLTPGPKTLYGMKNLGYGANKKLKGGVPVVSSMSDYLINEEQ